MRYILLFIGVVCLCLHSNILPLTVDNATESTNTVPLHFIENKGQWPEEVLYFSKSSGGQQFITNSGITYLVPRETDASRIKREQAASEPIPPVGTIQPRYEFLSLKIVFNDANYYAQPSGSLILPWKTHYLKGREQADWITGVDNYQRVTVENVYDGISVEYYSVDQRLEYDFVVSPEGNPEDISLTIQGADEVILTEEGEIEIHTEFDVIIQGAPITYQEIGGEKIPIEASYIVDGNRIRFALGEYDKTKAIVIDPTLRIRYIYGTSDDFTSGIDMDADHNIYLTGFTESTNFPATIGTYQGNLDAFAAKFDSLGVPIWIAFIGGSDDDKGRDIAVGPFNKVYIAGGTGSEDFPIAGPFVDDTQDGNGLNAFAMYLSDAGDVVMFSTYMGGYTPHGEQLGIDDDIGTSAYAIRVDDNGYFYVAGATNSYDLPSTSGTFDENYWGFTSIPGPSITYYADAFVMKFSPTGALTPGGFSTFIGGYGKDIATGIDIDDNGYIYVTGFTTALTLDPEDTSSFPYIEGSYGYGHLLSRTTFFTKISPDGSSLVYSGFYGGCNADNIAMGIAVDNNDCAYVTGYTTTWTFGCLDPFPMTAGAFDTSFNASHSSDAFVYKVNETGTDIVWSTFLGGEGNDYAYAIDVDEAGSPYVSGITSSNDFPIVDPGHISNNYTAPPSHLFLTKLHPDGTMLDFSCNIGVIYEDHQYGPAIVYDGQRVALSAYFEAPVVPTHMQGYIYSLGVDDLYQPMSFGSISLSQRSLFPMLLDSVNQISMTIEINTTGVLNPLELTEITLSTNGSDNPASNITNAKIYKLGASGTIDTTRQFGSAVAHPSGTYSITGSTLLSSGVNRFALTYDVPSSATVGDSLDAECLSVTIDGGTYIPNPTSNPGGAIVVAAFAGLSGTGQVGPGGDFTDLQTALGLIDQLGLSGDLTLELAPGTHYGQYTLPPTGSKSSATAGNNLTIQSAGDPNATILEFYATDSTTNFIIQVNGFGITDSIFIRNLTLNPLGDDFATAIEFTEGGRNTVVEGCTFNGNSVIGGHFKHKALIKTWSDGGFNRDLLFRNNTFNYGSAAISLEYGLGPITIDSNIFNEQYSHGVRLFDHHGPYIGNNVFNNSDPLSFASGIYLQNCFNNVIVEKNRIGSTFASGMLLNYVCGDDTLSALFANNFITETRSTASGAISCIGCIYTDLFHNNVNVTAIDTFTACLKTNSCSNFNIVNNIFVNTGGGPTMVDWTFKSPDKSPEWSDYNDLYTTGTILATWDGTNCADLTALQTASGNEANSISVDPGFVSETDLHTTNPALAGVGIYLDRVTDDIDGNVRDPLNPCIGGGEYTPSDVDDEDDALPVTYSLAQNYPNPFNPVTRISYSIARQSTVTLEVFNILGQCVITLVSEEQPAGDYDVLWDSMDYEGNMVASGVYFYRLRAGDFSNTKKMVLLK